MSPLQPEIAPKPCATTIIVDHRAGRPEHDKLAPKITLEEQPSKEQPN
jgi:hypothetical protein